jgi:hypothetical protein
VVILPPDAAGLTFVLALDGPSVIVWGDLAWGAAQQGWQGLSCVLIALTDKSELAITVLASISASRIAFTRIAFKWVG